MIAIVILLSFIFLIGAIVGSFLNVVILRTITEESIVFPPSKCPKCNTPLKWYHNIPIFSYIFLRGKCAFCKEKISMQYPIVELLTGFVFLGVSFFYLYSSIEWGFLDGIDFKTISFLIFTLIISSFYIIIAGIDIKSLIVYELHTYIVMSLGLLFGLIQSIHTGHYSILLYSLLGGIIFFALVWGLKLVFDRLLKTEAFGDGDPLIAGAIGTVMGSILPFGTDFMVLILVLLSIFLLGPLLYAIWAVPAYLYALYKENNYYLMSIISAFFLYVIAYVFALEVGWLTSNIAQIISFSIATILGLVVCFELLRSIRKNKSSVCAQIPFGPALVAAAFVMMFVIPSIANNF